MRRPGEGAAGHARAAGAAEARPHANANGPSGLPELGHECPNGRRGRGRISRARARTERPSPGASKRKAAQCANGAAGANGGAGTSCSRGVACSSRGSSCWRRWRGLRGSSPLSCWRGTALEPGREACPRPPNRLSGPGTAAATRQAPEQAQWPGNGCGDKEQPQHAEAGRLAPQGRAKEGDGSPAEENIK